MRSHDKEHLYKHVSLETAYAVLNSGCLRWSSPVQFNDPFDIPEVLYEDFDPKHLQSVLIDRVTKILEGTEDTSSRTLSPGVLLLKKLIAFAEEGMRKEIYSSFSEIVDSTDKLPLVFGELREFWAVNRKRMRILCLTDRWNSASMWDRYSSSHTGVVFELFCDEEIDSSLITAQEVIYSDEPMKISTVEGFVDYILFDPTETMMHMMEQNTLTKTLDWRNEQEFRVVSWKRKIEDEGDYSDYAIHPNEAKSIILGASMNQEDQDRLTLIANLRFPDIEIWKTAKTASRTLEKTRIK
ncbi:DUF2971 domain-containing protein [Pelagicoccus sp. SDUM812002]|uniref:DUF2971 domain-containing protein n=1 Tax=Pelagicoccus sp. SDUM812002 TaxID=3041266 RepID=UPI00280ED127|nr:DUF2971 domain-containing protein [Pelagicoccus sp. SDUM812002]MDQ8188577.1 DUF2971 domain-containing protein [Pelagicoccus sp. SDUM812002]